MLSSKTIQKIMSLETGWISDASDRFVICAEKSDHQIQFSVYEHKPEPYTDLTWVQQFSFCFRNDHWEASAGEILSRFFSCIARNDKGVPLC